LLVVFNCRKFLSRQQTKRIQDFNARSGKRKRLAGSYDEQRAFGKVLAAFTTPLELKTAIQKPKFRTVAKEVQQEALDRVGERLGAKMALAGVEKAGGGVNQYA
jgi:hypothetical protein